MPSRDPRECEASGLVLTAREAQVLARILRGLANKEIASELGLAEVSVKQYASTLLRKFGVPNRAALAYAGSRFALAGTRDLNPNWLPQLLRDSDVLIAVLTGPELRVVAVSDALVRLIGRPLVGRPLRDIFPEYQESGLLSQVDRVYRTGEPMVRHEQAVPLASGRWPMGYRDAILQPLRDEEGHINGVVYFGIDVTEEVHAARALSESLAK